MTMNRPDQLVLGPVTRASGRMTLPGSKSISNRVLLLAALAEGRTQLHGLLDSDYTQVMLQALRTLGVALEDGGEGRLAVQGVSRLDRKSTRLNSSHVKTS